MSSKYFTPAPPTDGSHKPLPRLSTSLTEPVGSEQRGVPRDSFRKTAEENLAAQQEAERLAHCLANPKYPDSLPTLLQLATFLQTFLPVRPRDVKFKYHSNRDWYPYPDNLRVPRLVLAITPTEAVYTALNRYSLTPPVAFIHRPFDLDRSRVRAGATVLSSHTGFDEALTVGYNTALAAKLGMCVDESVCLQGYKNDAERKIGIVGALPAGATLGSVTAAIAEEFRLGADAIADAIADGPFAESEIGVVAIMNAFAPAEVERVMDAAIVKGWVDDVRDGRKVLYLTGQARDAGVAAVQERGMKLICVGHEKAEEWGIRYLASEVRREFPEVEVLERIEGEEDLKEEAFLDRLAKEERLRDSKRVLY